ncbi:Transcription elongation factor SPT6 [Oopsacas minuta]|uniref:Transcription elongation factor SPT6 n=1 Tax=Oopsacas minuta TaxID=111878 RepID=A0AAV7K8S9_9METZ|nr:Transcription elongation factor SPT6 [Oopsacas minuta]
MVEMRNLSVEIHISDSDAHGNCKKLASRRNYFYLCKKYGLNSLACKFGLTPEQFGENLRESYQVHEPDQFPVEPEEASIEYLKLNTPFNTIEAILSGARHIVALQISHEPQIRAYFRTLFRKRARVFTIPTNKGKLHINDWHYCARYKYLRGKPVTDFKNDEFLLLLQAEEQELIQLYITLDESFSLDINFSNYQLEPTRNMQTYFNEIKHLYLRDDYSAVVTKWNEQRTKALFLAVHKYLYPVITQEMRFLLKTEAEKHVICQSMEKLSQWIDQVPYLSSLDRTCGDSSFRDLIFSSEHLNSTLIACSIFPEHDIPGYLVALDKDGNVDSYAKLNFLKNNLRKGDSHQPDFQLFKKLIITYEPKIIILSATIRNIYHIRDEVQVIINNLNEGSNTSLHSLVEIMDPNLANVSSQCMNLTSEFPDYPIQLRHAISMGRRAQDSLTEFASLATVPQNLLYLPLHNLQSRISQEDLCDALQFQLCKTVSNVGVDINSCLKSEHKSCLLSFVPGLGPRKASALLKRLQQDGSILENRSQLITICEIGPTVFLNCAAFIKIDVKDIREKGTDSYIEDLDGSRVHPETYDWAKKMAVDALEYDDTTEDFDSTEAVQRILQNSEKLRELDLDAFASQLEKENFGDKRATLYDIRDELEGGCFKDRRKQFQGLNKQDVFEILFDNPLATHTQKIFVKGKLVTCKVVNIERRKPTQEQSTKISPERNEITRKWACPFCKKSDFSEFSLVWIHCDEGSCPGEAIGIRTILENGLYGFISIHNISSSTVVNVENHVQIGMTITCRILSVNYQKFSLELSCKSSDLQDVENRFVNLKDKFYDYKKEKDDTECEKSSSKNDLNHYIKRIIVHPKFKNLSYEESLPLLENLLVGDCLIRPSSRGYNRLTLSLKIDDNIYQHIDIVEKDKTHTYSIGKSLWINNEEYEDLDEILAMYVNRISNFLKELRTHKCFRPPSTNELSTLETLLTQEKRINPSRIPYFISPSVNFPGKFILAYTPKLKALTDYISLNPQGLKFRNKIFDSLSQMLKWFKDHYVISLCNREVSTIRPSQKIPTYPKNSSIDERTFYSSNLSTQDKQYTAKESLGRPNPIANSEHYQSVRTNSNYQFRTQKRPFKYKSSIHPFK